MTKNIKDQYIDEFKNDPVYRMVINSKLEGYLFPETLLEIDTNKTYSTIEVGKFIGRKDSTIRNYFKTELLDYIDPEKVGNLYRLDYINIFKIHMISLLFEKGKKSKTEIAYELGIKSGVKVGKTSEVPDFIKQQNSDIDKIKQYLFIEKMKTTQLKRQNDLQQIINQKQEKQIEYNELKAYKDNLSNAYLEENYFEALAAAVEDLSDLEIKNIQLVKESKEKKGILNWFMRKNKENESATTPSVSNTSNRISDILKGSTKQQKEINIKTERIENDIESIKRKISDLEVEINNKQAEISNNNIYIENAENNLLADDNMFNNNLLRGDVSNDVSKSKE